ncbi:cytochrome c oxidase subunit II [Bacillaceae bacterium S4-13-56]
MKGWMGKFKALFIFGLIALFLTGCGEPNLSALQPKGEGAETLYDLMMLSIYVMVGVFLVVMTIYTFVLIRYRQKKGQEDFIPEQKEGNHLLEIVWTVIPILLLLVLAVPTVITTFELADAEPPADQAEDAIVIQVTGKQFWWHFNYENEEIQTSQDMYIPTDTRVYLKLRSDDVIHSFWLPSIAGKMDANPGGNENKMTLLAYEEGVYEGKCTEFCGDSHSLMDFKVIAVSPEEYEDWVSGMKAESADEKPETTTALEGQQLFQEKSCIGCHAVDAGSQVQTGPNLTNFGNRSKVAGFTDNTKENVVEWLSDPQDVKPGNKMPNVGLTKEEASKIADYLQQLKIDDKNE